MAGVAQISPNPDPTNISPGTSPAAMDLGLQLRDQTEQEILDAQKRAMLALKDKQVVPVGGLGQPGFNQGVSPAATALGLGGF